MSFTGWIRKAENGLRNKGRVTAVLAALAMTAALMGCADTENPYEEEKSSTVLQEERREDAVTPADTSSARGVRINVNKETGGLSVTRTVPEFTGEVGEEGIWTVFVYLCGTDLESLYGMGTGDLAEMLDAESSDRVRFVVQTGGAYQWDTSQVDAETLQRFLIQNGEITRIEEQPLAGMGMTQTLTDFLTWGMEEFASEHMGLVLWNHGGGSITGVCFDELDDYDSLSLVELDKAFCDSLMSSGRRFDFIGFDACLMGTVETANILATYADYMYASEETEPGSGWDYTAIGDFLAQNPDADGAELGRVVCDSFLAACEEQDADDLTTLSVIDLSKMDDLLSSFNEFATEMYLAGEDASARADMIRAIERADNFGGNNKTEGYTNMVDMGGMIEACGAYSEGAQKTLAALQEAVVYSVSGPVHSGASGLSIYYPLSIQGSEELSIFEKICVSPYYLSFVDRKNQGSIGSDGFAGYDDSQWFDDNGEWSYGAEDNDDYWNYLDEYEQTGESPYITLAVEPQLDEDGSYWFALDEEGYYNTADVYAMVYQTSADGADLIELGETYDINADWETGVFYDDFDGWWLSLPDGQNLATYIVEDALDYTIYTSPIMLNGEETNLRIKLDYTNAEIVIEGAWDGIDEYGAAAREVTKLKEGDVIIPLYYAYAIEGDEEYYYTGVEYTVDGTPEIYYDMMESGDYFYGFCIDDIYGDYYITDFVMFNVDGEDISFYVD